MAAETQKTKSGGNFLTGIRTYLGEVRSELNKVSWPDREDVVTLTRIVLLVTIVSSAVLGILSFALSLILNQFGLQNPIILVIIFAVIIGVTLWSFRQGEHKSY